MDGNQLTTLKTAATRLDTAITDYDSAYHSSGVSEDTLNKKLTERTNANTAFESAYQAYADSMRAASQNPASKASFVPHYNML